MQVLGNPDFEEARLAATAAAKRAAYKKLKEGRYTELEIAPTAEAVELGLKAWEAAHQEQLRKTRVKGFFGAPNVASGKLKKRTSVNLVPAVKDINTDIGTGKKSPVLSLLANIAEQTIKNREEFAIFLNEATNRFAALTDPESIPQLADIGANLTTCLKQYYSDAKLSAEWDRAECVTVNFPTPRISIGHRDIDTGVDFVGHGLQRAVLFSVVQYLAELEPKGEPVVGTYPEAQSDIIILIEEPEIYQHPGKQVLIYEALSQIADVFNTQTGIRFQVIYTTHSEKLVDVRNFAGVRIIRKVTPPDLPMQTICRSYTLDECRHQMAEVVGRPAMSREAFAAKLHIVTREISEGFFAHKVVFVEGVSDRAILEGAYKARNRHPQKEGIALISTDGKTKIDKPALIFSKLSIPTYIIADNDSPHRNQISCNRILQTISGKQNVEDFPSGVYARIAFYEGNLEEYLKVTVGREYSEMRRAIGEEFGLDEADLEKTPAAVARLFEQARRNDVRFQLIDSIIEKIDELH